MNGSHFFINKEQISNNTFQNSVLFGRMDTVTLEEFSHYNQQYVKISL